jgi:hypothetical protein
MSMRFHHLAAVVALAGIGAATTAGATEPADTKDSDERTLSARDLDVTTIINGEDASSVDYPMTGGLLVDTVIDMGSWGTFPMQSFMCSSTLIAPDAVLIAAHCIDPAALTFGLGDLMDTEYAWSREADLSAYDGSSTGAAWPDDAVLIADSVMHPTWDMNNLQVGLSKNYDVAILFLAEPVLDVPPALLPSAAEASTLAEGLDVAVVGWGQQTHVAGWGSAPPEGTFMLKQQGMSYIAELAEFEFQVGAEEDDVRKCHGDSGGPSFAWVGQDTTETMRLVGVTSHAYDSSDCESKGGVDTRVDYYLDWIDEEMRSRCEDGTRVWCDEPGVLPTDYFEASSEDDTGDTGGDVDGSGDAGADTVDGEEGSSKGGCSTAAGAFSGVGLVVSMLAVARRRDD